MYHIYNKIDNTYLGTIMNAKNEYKANYYAMFKYGKNIYLSQTLIS